MSFWHDQRVLVTGGNGFLGKAVVECLQKNGCKEILAPHKIDYDLRDARQIDHLLNQFHPDLIIHLAAICGGIEANRQAPGTFFYDNAIMGIQLIEAARKLNVRKTVVLGTICAYPKFTPIPFREDQIWNGYPEETNAPYGLAKKMLLVQLRAYREQYGFSGIYLLPVNLYGPRDNFDLTTSHVIPAIIRKMVDARDAHQDTVELWGSGEPSREFLYVDDCAEGILLASERYDRPEPVNLGVGTEIKIKDLALLIQKSVGFEGTLRWDATRPDGQPRRSLDTSRAREAFGFQAKTSFESGLLQTIRWYEQNKGAQ